MRDLLLATTNKHKLDEFHAVFTDVAFRLLSLHDFDLDLDVEEIGTTFAENAAHKARTYAQATGLLSLSEDSGLEIDALGGAPGIYSARFAGRETPYPERFHIILEQLKELPHDQRGARFHCAMSIAEPSGYQQTVHATLEGIIADHPRGTYGFGYDPIFLLPEQDQTTAELMPEHKNRISHRARAAQLVRDLLKHWPLSS